MHTKNTRSIRSVAHYPLAKLLFFLLAFLLAACGDGNNDESNPSELGGALGSDEQLVQFAMAEITQYLAARPSAADTAEGIHSFWIRWEGDLPPRQVTDKALANLEQNGMIESLHVGEREVWRRRTNA